MDFAAGDARRYRQRKSRRERGGYCRCAQARSDNEGAAVQFAVEGAAPSAPCSRRAASRHR